MRGGETHQRLKMRQKPLQKGFLLLTLRRLDPPHIVVNKLLKFTRNLAP